MHSLYPIAGLRSPVPPQLVDLPAPPAPSTRPRTAAHEAARPRAAQISAYRESSPTTWMPGSCSARLRSSLVNPVPLKQSSRAAVVS